MKLALLFCIMSVAMALPIQYLPSELNTSRINNTISNISIGGNVTEHRDARALLFTIDDTVDTVDDTVADTVDTIDDTYDELGDTEGGVNVDGSDGGGGSDKLVGNSGKKDVVIPVPNVNHNNNTNKSVVVSSDVLTNNLHIYHNHTTHHLKNLESKIIAMLKKTRQTQKEEETDNKNNYDNEKKILNNKKLERKRYEQTLVSLHQQIVNLNKTILEYWGDIHSDTTYLQKLDLLKPKFTGSVDKVNNEMAVLNKYITDTIIEGDDKKEMLSMMFNIKNKTYYSSNDLAEAFLHHYEKYKNQLGKDTSYYHAEIEKLSSLIAHYKLVASKVSDVDYTEIVNIVKKLKNVYKLSKENTQLLDDLIYKIISILKNKSCSAKSFTSSTKECSLELLKSHIANKLV
jgi:hypothetical protein